jgi:outer membrane protein
MKRFALVVAVVAAATAASAQDAVPRLRDVKVPATLQAAAPAAGPVTLDRCLELARKNGHRQKAAQSAQDVAAAQHGQAMSSRFPTVTASFSATELDENPNFLFPASSLTMPASYFPIPAMKVTIPANAFGPGFPPTDVPLTVPGSYTPIPAQTYPIPEQNVQLMDRTLLTLAVKALYPLYTGGLAGGRIAQTKAGMEAARQEQRQTEAEVTYDVRRAYWGVVLTNQLLEVSRDTLARMEATLELTQHLFESGSGRVKKTDFLRNKAMAETIRGMVAELENQQRSAKAGLEAAVEWDGSAPIEVADKVLPYSPSSCQVPLTIAQAMGFSPQLARLQAGVAAARAGVSVARSSLLPKAGLFADVHQFGNSLESGMLTKENKFGWSVGIGIEMPLFDGLRGVNELREARASLQKLQHQDVLLRQALTYEVKTTCSQVAKGADQVKSSRDAYQAASESRDLNVRAYQEELVETKDVIEAQLMEAILAAQHYRALFDNLEAQAKLEMVAGQAAPAKK